MKQKVDARGFSLVFPFGSVLSTLWKFPEVLTHEDLLKSKIAFSGPSNLFTSKNISTIKIITTA